MIFFADHVFIDPMFFGIFVCGPLQSLVVNVCTLISVFIASFLYYSFFLKSEINLKLDLNLVYTLLNVKLMCTAFRTFT